MAQCTIKIVNVWKRQSKDSKVGKVSFHLTTKCEEAIYRVHSANCQDVKRDIRNGFDDEGTFDDVDDIVMFLFEDMVYEYIDAMNCTIEEARASFYDELEIMPCAR